MKISVIITTILVAQVSASFFDVFHGAVLSVQNSFGKLLSDVVTDVKETVDCTILAVEHVLSLSHDATTRYYEKCGSVTNKTDSVSNTRQDASLPKVEVTFNLPNNEEYLRKVVPAEIDARINENLSKVLGSYNKSHDSVLSIENVLAKESERLADVSVLVKKELDKLSEEVTTELKNKDKQMDLKPSVDGILQEIKVLEKREQNTKNISEANEIHQVIDKVLSKLGGIEATEASENIKLEEILKALEMNSNNTFVGLRHQFEEWKAEESRHLSEIKSKIEEHEKIFVDPRSYNMHGLNLTQPVMVNTDTIIDSVESKKISQVNSSHNITTQVKETLDRIMSSKMVGDINKPLISVPNERSFSESRFNESGLNKTLILSSPYSTTNIPFSKDVIGISELLTLSRTQSSTTQNNSHGNGTNTTSITDNPRVNETRESSVSATILSVNKSYLNETVITSRPVPATETLGDINHPVSVKNNTYSKNNESSDLVKNEDTVISPTQNSSNNDNSNQKIKTSIIANTKVEKTTLENSEYLTSATHLFLTTLATFNVNESKYTMTPSSLHNIQPVESNTKLDNVESSTVTSKIVNDNDSTESKIANSTLFTIERTPAREIVQPIETTSEFSKETSITPGNKKFSNGPNGTMITSSTLSGNETLPEYEIIRPEENKKSSNGPNGTMITSSPLPTNETLPEYEIIRPEENKKSSNGPNGTMITSNPLPTHETLPEYEIIRPEENKKSLNGLSGTTIKSSPSSTDETLPEYEIIRPEETNTTYGDEMSSQAITETTSTSKVDDGASTSIQTPKIIVSESETIQTIYTTTVSINEQESIISTTSSPTKDPNTTDENDSSATTITSTAAAVSENISEEMFMTTESEEPSTTYSPIDSPATLIDTESNARVIITSTQFPMTETTAISDEVEPDESTTLTESEKPSILLTTPVTIVDEVINENTKSEEMSVTTEKTESAAVTEIIETAETTSASEKTDLLSTFTSTQSAINEDVTGTESSILASRYEADFRSSMKSETKEFSQTSKILNNPDRSFMLGSPPLTITDSVNSSVNRESLNSEVPTVPPITRGLFTDALKFMAPDRLIPDSDQQPKINIFDSNDRRLLHSDSRFGPDEGISKIPNVPSMPIDPQIMNNENPLNVPTSLHRIRPPYLFGDTVEQVLTTLRPTQTDTPTNTAAPINNYKPQEDSEAHQRVLKEARQLMANSRRSRRIINNIMKNKNKFKARSVFNG